MKKLPKILTIVLLLLNLSALAQSQSILDYTFEKYPAKVSTAPKAKLNLSSHKLGSTFRTVITEEYKNGKVIFGGHYVLVSWGCGSSCEQLAMIDITDGKIYQVLDEATHGMGCSSSAYENFVGNKSTSRLFMSISCNESEIENTSNSNQEFIYTILIWDEAAKKFSTPLEITKNEIVKSSY